GENGGGDQQHERGAPEAHRPPAVDRSAGAHRLKMMTQSLTGRAPSLRASWTVSPGSQRTAPGASTSRPAGVTSVSSPSTTIPRSGSRLEWEPDADPGGKVRRATQTESLSRATCSWTGGPVG